METSENSTESVGGGGGGGEATDAPIMSSSLESYKAVTKHLQGFVLMKLSGFFILVG